MSRILRSGRMIGKHGKRAATNECYFCKGRIVEQKVTVDFRWGDKLKVIENVPAGVCQQCGEKYFRSDIYKLMEKMASSRQKPVARLLVDVLRFNEAV